MDRIEDFKLRPAWPTVETTHKENGKTETSVQAGRAAVVHLKCLGASCLLGNLRKVFVSQSQTHVC